MQRSYFHTCVKNPRRQPGCNRVTLYFRVAQSFAPVKFLCCVSGIKAVRCHVRCLYCASMAAAEHRPAGFGLSGHMNAYRNRTLEGNWAEERLASTVPVTRPRFQAESTSHADFGPQGKYEAAKDYSRHDLGCSSQGSSKDMFVQQKDIAGRPVPCFATINQLAYGHCDPDQKNAHVQQFMWAGAKGNDLGVPLNTGDSGKLLQSKTAQWKEEFQPYSTTKSLAGKQVTDALAAGVPIKRQTCRPATEGGQASTAGRKANGEFVNRLDEDWVKIKLRNLNNI